MHRAAAQAGGIGMPKRKTSRQWCDWGRLQSGMDRQPGRLVE
jgi:hypothetical protein